MNYSPHFTGPAVIIDLQGICPYGVECFQLLDGKKYKVSIYFQYKTARDSFFEKVLDLGE